METIKLGDLVKTLVKKSFKEEGSEDYTIPKGTIGVACDIMLDKGGLFVDFWGRVSLPEGATGVGGYDFDEIELVER